MSNRFVAYSPHLSRRLGVSLGVDLLDFPKKCTFNCVYCEIGETRPEELVDRNFRYDPPFEPAQFREELEEGLGLNPGVESVTFGYNGEPTLAVQLGKYLAIARDTIRGMYGSSGSNAGRTAPHCSVFTNSSTLDDGTIINTLSEFDLVVAKLDCATERLFNGINRPHRSVLPVERIIQLLKNLREAIDRNPGHQLAIQTLLFTSTDPAQRIPGNFSIEELKALANAYLQIQPHIVQLYTVWRSPPEPGLHPLSMEEKEQVKAIMRSLLHLSIAWHVY